MKKVILLTLISLFLANTIYAVGLATYPYELTSSETTQLNRFLLNEGYKEQLLVTRSVTNQFNTLYISFETEPIIKTNYKEKICVNVTWERNKPMCTSNKRRMVCYNTTDFYIQVYDVDDDSLTKLVDTYFRAQASNQFSFIKLGNIKSAYKYNNEFHLCVDILEHEYHSFVLVFKEERLRNYTRIEIVPVPIP